MLALARATPLMLTPLWDGAQALVLSPPASFQAQPPRAHDTMLQASLVTTLL